MTKEYNVSELVKEIRVALDMNNSSSALSALGDVDTLTVDEVIESKIEDAARCVVQSAPVNLLGNGKAFGDTIGWDMEVGRGSGHTVLPNDFLRLIVFQMSDWTMPVTDAISVDSPAYAMQRSKWAGVRGTPERPVVAIVSEPIGLVLEFYSCTQGEHAYVKMARYAPIPKIEEVDGEQVIRLSEHLYRAVVYYGAYLTSITLNDTDKAKSLLSVCNEILGI